MTFCYFECRGYYGKYNKISQTEKDKYYMGLHVC